MVFAILCMKMPPIVSSVGFFQEGKGLLVEKLFQRWKDAISEFNAHFCNIISDKTKGCHGNKLHLSAVTRATEVVRQIEGKNLPITQMMDETSQKQVMKSKAAIKSIAQTVYFLVRQGGDRNLTTHFESCHRNATFKVCSEVPVPCFTSKPLQLLKISTIHMAFQMFQIISVASQG